MPRSMAGDVVMIYDWFPFGMYFSNDTRFNFYPGAEVSLLSPGTTPSLCTVKRASKCSSLQSDTVGKLECGSNMMGGYFWVAMLGLVLVLGRIALGKRLRAGWWCKPWSLGGIDRHTLRTQYTVDGTILALTISGSYPSTPTLRTSVYLQVLCTV
ncbi:uncharacterized protein EI97DRAFT_240926 [Westerdykella ornata]|uniref:Uncharacterized protein n=1 Tax=Westerdykella ornata TaxID=318751 RepID=A0A6A6J624_WESOR|nr:uncharacterized protein EI97DRAFT_240926 [Westerdykella ornata]KAF2271842.1 hypothetical protein EI97DRAFT_240926 [Westerdykella ornata]